MNSVAVDIVVDTDSKVSFNDHNPRISLAKEEKMKMKTRNFFLCLPLFFSLLQTAQADELEHIMKSIQAADIFEINEYLSTPEMRGRLAGTEAYDKAAQWAEVKFKEWGLVPVYDDFLQTFGLSYNETHDSNFSLILPPIKKKDKPETLEMEMYKDYCPTLYSGFGEVENEVVFLGFGITAPELGWDDYKDLDVKGKVVAIIDGMPQVEGKDFSKYYPRPYKLQNAKEHEAGGLIIINRAVISGYGTYQEGMPMVMVGNKVAEALFKHKGFDIQIIRALLRDGNPLRFTTGVRAKVKVTGIHHPNAFTSNVVGMMEGSDPALKEECLIFGAHLDGVGPWPRLHPAASDNASGSAVVMKLAHAFSQLNSSPKRSIVFALFGGEELGLLGSRYMAANMPDFPSKPILMLNHDMNGVGRGLRIAGGKTYPEFYQILTKVNEKYSINDRISASEISQRFGNSDYAPFVENGIPSYSTWVTGGGGYGVHTEEDTIYVITPKIMEDIVRLFFMAGYLFADK